MVTREQFVEPQLMASLAPCVAHAVLPKEARLVERNIDAEWPAWGALLMLTGTPLPLGSWWGTLSFAAMALILAWRLLDEEKYLAAHLTGYQEYRRKVRYRLLPLVW